MDDGVTRDVELVRQALHLCYLGIWEQSRRMDGQTANRSSPFQVPGTTVLYKYQVLRVCLLDEGFLS